MSASIGRADRDEHLALRRPACHFEIRGRSLGSFLKDLDWLFMLWRPVMSALLAATAPSRVVIVPGNGCSGEVRDANWYGWLEQQLVADGAFEEVVLRNMPDPVVARESVWVPFLRDELACDARTIVVGHSSGAEAAMRLAETTALGGIVLVAACHTDLGSPSEAAAVRRARARAGLVYSPHSHAPSRARPPPQGYYSRPWSGRRFGPTPGSSRSSTRRRSFIPLAEARHVAENLGSTLTDASGARTSSSRSTRARRATGHASEPDDAAISAPKRRVLQQHRKQGVPGRRRFKI